VRAVIIKGGHLPGEPVDTLLLDEEFLQFPGHRLEGAPVHGTGCLYSATLTARLAAGDSIPEACLTAKATVTRAITQAVTLGKGNRLAIL
jgi:hydroxymethylpyrimidine/phosphomethylpyrimidine kinase